jgi:type IV secretion system protein VirB4
LAFRITDSSRRVDKSLYNNSSEDFIPIACHYDANTLLTKNGELLQTIQINGINAENISDKLFNLREVVRSAIKKNVQSTDFAFWIHTVRRKTNLDDQTTYHRLLPANIHHLWQQKNYWDDKFVNTLYISIIHDSAEIKIKNLRSLINSLFFKVVEDFQNKYLDNSFQKLNNTVDAILLDLQEFGAIKLGISFKKEESFSDLMFLYRRIVHLSEEYCLVPIANLSNALASNQYAVGSDKIEVISEHDKKFAAILSIKEYQEVSSEALDKFLQIPVELIATEIFYFVDKQEVSKGFTEKAYILQVSKDAHLAEIKGISKILNSDDPSPNQFCKQQISISIIGSDLIKLDQSIAQASRELSRLGIIHVLEDINLEQTFWSQLPGNFSYVNRMNLTIIENTAVLASLHNFPTGNQNNIWGKAVTLLRTEKGTPYFMNFHSASNNRGNCCIFGVNNTGKTVLTNFLISEATKYKPTILYLSNNNDSKIFIEAIEGKWFEKEKNLLNPFLLDDTAESRIFVIEFLKIICNNSFYPLTAPELAFLEKFTNKIFTLEMLDRNFSAMLKMIDFTSEGGEGVKLKLTDYMEGGLYDGIFDTNIAFLSEGAIIGFNLNRFSEKSFTDRFYPTERKQLDSFSMNLTKQNSLCVGLIYAFNHHLTLMGKNPKILVIDNLDSLCKVENFGNITKMVSDRLQMKNGIMVSNFDFTYLKSSENGILHDWLDLLDTKIILPSEIKLEYLNKILGLTESEINKLSKFIISSRMFLISQNGQAVAVELSIGGLVGIVKILSCRDGELTIYQEILQQYPGHPDNWINPLYKALNHI